MKKMDIVCIAHDDCKGYDKIIINGHVPIDNEHPYRLGRHKDADPLNCICLHEKKELLRRHGACVAYHITRDTGYAGEQTTEIHFRFSNTGTCEIPHNHPNLEATCAYWQGIMAQNCAEQIIKYLDDVYYDNTQK